MRKMTVALLIGLISLSSLAQSTHKGLPMLKARSVKADYRIGGDWVKGRWNISPHIKSDSLLITCHDTIESFAFYTNQDSITINLKPGRSHSFYVSLNDTAYALTVVKGISANYTIPHYDEDTTNSTLKFWYEQDSSNEYLHRLRSQYPIDSLIVDCTSDTEKALKIMHWVHNQWRHNGQNQPKKKDAISILEEVKEGKNFRCVEYGIVTTACLNAVGLPARTLGLKTKNVETTKSGAGHVLLEVYLKDLKKWVLLDGQWDAMPVLNNNPLNAVEFQTAISENYDELEIKSISGVSKRQYIDWIFPYLYYLDVSFDNRQGFCIDKEKVKGKQQLMLVPLGAKEPTIFQVKYTIDYCIYTHSLNDFYAPPTKS